ncbi:metallophosphoesterase [Collimonas fungivorans]|uniref:Putative membrane bound phosphoesterase n=1 Tax=Collimonas fungivorans (strain Ter331) TaxID=1005048 RepID=G0ABY1_COLFT|nr:metallophosphoesterase [Collimonas fungivorans]AEK62178.1 putative membrane bound phosphoesterase [Collimonas fungivorans Ter331]
MPSRFAIVLVLFLLGVLHALIGWLLVPALSAVPFLPVLLGAWLLLSFLLIPGGMLARGIQSQPLSDRLAWAGMLAMGIFSSLLLATLLRELALWLAPLFRLDHDQFAFWSAVAVLLLAAVSSLIGFFNARRLAAVVDVDVPISGLPAALHGYSIVQISDIHVGPTIKHNYLDAIVSKVNTLKPDLIAVTGDLVDGSVQELAAHTAPLAKLRSRHGAYFVTGNHEYYSNAPEWVAEVRRLGLTVLMNQHVVINHQGASLLVAGVTDYSAHHFDQAERSDPHAALAGSPPHVAVKLLLAHQPRSATAAADAGFDLQLSGHTHGGQFFPWNLFVPLQQPYTAGLNRLRNLWVYTSRGTGYWGPPKRLFAPSEITRLRLVQA